MRHFLSLADYSGDELHEMLNLSVRLKDEWKRGGNSPLLQGKVLAMVFEKPSLRTRVSFDMAMRHLGGDALYISPNEVGLGTRESVPDVSRVLSRYVDAVMARVFDHENLLTLARHSSVPVINGLSDYNHPCQAMADALTILERFGQFEGVKVSYVGDGNNVAVSLLFAAAQLGMDFAIATPQEYELPPNATALAAEMAKETRAEITLTRDPVEAVDAAQVIYTDTWVSMGQEKEAEERHRVFADYQVNAALVEKADPSAIVMHCLPAHRGLEITDQIMDGPHSVIFEQAENRLHAQKAILLRLLT